MSDIKERLRERADTMNGTQPVGASDGYGTVVLGYYGGGDAKLDREAADHIAALEAECERLREALTPSADTKAEYMGEFHIGLNLRAGNQRDFRRVPIPWTSIKEIMAAIRARAAREALKEAS